MIVFRPYLLPALWLTVFWLAVFWHTVPAHGQEVSDAVQVSPVEHIHFAPFEFSVLGSDRSVYFTLFIQARQYPHLLYLCDREQKIRAVVHKLLFGRKELERLGHYTLYLKRASRVLHGKLTQALGYDWIKTVYFVRGEFTKKEDVVRFPFITKPQDCSEIRR